MTPQRSVLSLKDPLTSPTSTLSPNGFALVLITAKLYGNILLETKMVFLFSLKTLKHMAIASAAAVPSSSKLAFATGTFVSSVTNVWKFSKLSSLP